LALWRLGHATTYSFWATFFVALIGRAIKLYFLVGGLIRPEEYRKMLEKMVSDKLPGSEGAGKIDLEGRDGGMVQGPRMDQ
jgi:hypothetical protein